MSGAAKYVGKRVGPAKKVPHLKPKTAKPDVDKFKREHDYDPNPPRCATCTSFRRPRVVLRDSMPKVYIHGVCQKMEIASAEAAVCDAWQGRKGELLEAKP